MKAKIIKIGITLLALIFAFVSPSWADGRHHQKREINSARIHGHKIKHHRIQHHKRKWHKHFHDYHRKYHHFHRPAYKIKRDYIKHHDYGPVYKHRHFHYHY